MTFSETSGKVYGANVPLIFGFETVNTVKFVPEVTIKYQLQGAFVQPMSL